MTSNSTGSRRDQRKHAQSGSSAYSSVNPNHIDLTGSDNNERQELEIMHAKTVMDLLGAQVSWAKDLNNLATGENERIAKKAKLEAILESNLEHSSKLLAAFKK